MPVIILHITKNNTIKTEGTVTQFFQPVIIMITVRLVLECKKNYQFKFYT